MITKKQELKLYGIVLIIFGFIDLAYLYLDINEVKALLANYTTPVIIAAYVLMGVVFLMALAKFWMGRQALCYANGTGKGTSHILLAKVGMVFGVVALAAEAFSFFTGTSSLSDTFGSAANLIVMYSYYKAAKDCL